MNRKQKEAAVADLRASFNTAQGVIVADFKGLSMEEMKDLRAKVRETEANFKVAKNTLVKIASKDTPAKNLNEMMVGNNALGFTEGDVAALAKALVDFAKKNDKLVIKGGLLGAKVLDLSEIKSLASLPSREILLATLLGTMQAVPTGFVRVLAAVPQKLVYALAAIKDQKAA